MSTPAAVSCSTLRAFSRLTDDTGMIEHAWHAVPRYSTGYCTDDNGRALALVCEIGGGDAADYARRYLAFLYHAHLGGGCFRLRLGYDRTWTDDPPSEDADGRAIRGVAVAAACGPTADIRVAARELFESTADRGFRFWRASAHALIGATSLLDASPDDSTALAAVRAWATSIPAPAADPSWRWPEARLGYENALLPHALIKSGVALSDDDMVGDGLALLDWLVETETRGDHYSFTPVGGAAAACRRPAFDQQPIEAWAMAEACAVALRVTADPSYSRALDRVGSWLHGENDAGVPMLDPSTGGGFDGLKASGVNRNQGGESQLAAIAIQHLTRPHRTPPE